MKKHPIIFILPLMLFVSCAKSLDDYNVDRKKPTEVPAYGLFTGAVFNLADIITTPNVNSNSTRYFVQYWTTTTYLDEPRYNLTARTIPLALWQGIYRDVLADLAEAKRIVAADPLLEEAEKNNQTGQIEVMEVYAWSVLVTSFGDIPYSQALDITNTQPAYDDDLAIYADLMTRLDAALGKFDTDEGGFDSSADVLYGGNIAMWVKFGNSLKLKMALVLADVNSQAAAAAVQQAAPNVFTSASEGAIFPFEGATPNNNPISDNLNPDLTNRTDFLPANTLVNTMNSLGDPRRDNFFHENITGGYAGANYGFTNSYDSYSHFDPAIYQLDFPGPLLTYSEVEFYLAEAVERGFISGSAADHYNKAVTASILEWRGTTAEATAYLAQPSVAYATATGPWQRKIGTQAWIAFFNRGYEGWLQWRRLNYPVLSPPSGGNAPSGLAIPVRLIYPPTESSLNASYAAAAQAIGGDLVTTKLFWDVN